MARNPSLDDYELKLKNFSSTEDEIGDKPSTLQNPESKYGGRRTGGLDEAAL